MNIVHLSHTDGGSGAGRAAYRIHASLCELGLDSIMLVSQKRTSDPSVFEVSRTKLGKLFIRVFEYLEGLSGRLVARSKDGYISPSFYCFNNPVSLSEVQRAEIVSLYWVNGAYMKPEHLSKLRKPIVWRLSDTWPFTGGCHYPGDCKKFQLSCGNCPQLGLSYRRDLTNKLWKRKFHSWQNANLTIVAPSEWIAKLARGSSLFSNRKILVIPTGINLECYKPMDLRSARARWNLPQEKLVIMFGAMSPMGDRRKGFDELYRALEVLAKSLIASDVIAVVFGADQLLPINLPVTTISLGQINDELSLATAYGCADLVVVPSLEDNLPNVALEAQACGIPVAGFNVCGMPEIIIDGWNGCLADLSDPDDLGNVMVRMLSNIEDLRKMGLNARIHSEEKFSSVNQALAYKRLYEELVFDRGNLHDKQ